jgi:hypothetical protein
MSRGGSRYGAGRPGWRRKCEQMNGLDIRRLHRKGRLVAGQSFWWSWSRGDEPCGSINVATSPDHLQLSYRWTPSNRDPQAMSYPVMIERTLCNYGGMRQWFRCPRCYRRCALLYGVANSDGRFGCRICMRLAYSSEAESQLDRLWRKQRKIEAHLIAGEARPKGMHWRTYERLIERIDGIEEAKDGYFVMQLLPLLRRSGMMQR